MIFKSNSLSVYGIWWNKTIVDVFDLLSYNVISLLSSIYFISEYVLCDITCSAPLSSTCVS